MCSAPFLTCLWTDFSRVLGALQELPAASMSLLFQGCFLQALWFEKWKLLPTRGEFLMWVICSVTDVHLATRHRPKPPGVLGMGCSRGDSGWAPFAFHADTAAHSAATWEAGDLCTSAPKLCSGCLELPFSPAFVRAAFPTTPSSACMKKGLLAVAQGWGAEALLGECPLWSAVSRAWREGWNLGTTFPSHFVTLVSIWRNLSNFG